VLFPSVADLIFLVLAFLLSCGTIAPRLLGDAGIGWHIRNGELMLQTHAITRTDPFSSTMQGKPWYAWEWLYDLLIATMHHWMGLNGVVLLTALVIAATFALTLRLALQRGASLQVAVVLVLLAAGASTIHFLARPHVLSWLFTVVWFGKLDSFEISPQHWRRLLWLPALMLLWVNVHGGFLVGFALLAIYLLSGFVRWISAAAEAKGAAKQSLQRLAGTAVLCLLASLVNPYGYKLYVHIYGYLTDRFLMNHIDEFLSPNFHGVAQQCFAALLLITLVALAVRRETLPLSQLLVALFAAYSGLYATRNLPVSAILLTLLIAPWLTRSMDRAGTNESIQPWLRRCFRRGQSFAARMGRMEAAARWHLWPTAACAFLLWVAAHGGNLGPQRLMNARFDHKRFPVEAAEIASELGIHEPIFCPDSWGGYLIYRLYPQVHVVVDDRHDLYGPEFLKKYLTLVRVEPGWEEVLNGEHANWLLLPAESPLANVLKQTDGWEAVHEDSTAILFERVET